MFRHVIPPARFYSQVPNDLIRHPRLNSDAFRLLSWQLSLPADKHESLSATAERAGIKPKAFQRAKQQLRDEGYFHEWKEQGPGGLWRTRQLVSNVPLTAEEVARLREAAPVEPAPTAPEPAAGERTVGEPKDPSVGRHPEEAPGVNTSNPPPPDQADTEARQLVAALRELDPRLCVPRGMLRQLAALAAQWLRLGHTPEAVRDGIRRGLPAVGESIHRPGGLVRYLLREVPPVEAPPEPPKVALMRECTGEHTQPRLFRPVADEGLCPDCRQDRARATQTEATARPATGVRAAVRGAAAARAAMRGGA
ncbi:hypothetical protein [Streptomyces sp. NPDC002187]|uniref:hypothetical protein n=1 Tax=Streptomyces sp. NPDC002187 TaxID=3364637 RepID=UPI00368539E8